MPLDNRPPHGREATAQRRDKAMELRKAGCTYRQIGHALGVSHVAAWKLVRAAMRRLAAAELRHARALRQAELRRLDAVVFAVWPRVLAGDLDAAGVILKTVERRARLCGLYAPTKLAPPACRG